MPVPSSIEAALVSTQEYYSPDEPLISDVCEAFGLRTVADIADPQKVNAKKLREHFGPADFNLRRTQHLLSSALSYDQVTHLF